MLILNKNVNDSYQTVETKSENFLKYGFLTFIIKTHIWTIIIFAKSVKTILKLLGPTGLTIFYLFSYFFIK